MDYPEFIEWIAFIRLQNAKGEAPAKGPQSWQELKSNMLRHMNLVKPHGRD